MKMPSLILFSIACENESIDDEKITTCLCKTN